MKTVEAFSIIGLVIIFVISVVFAGCVAQDSIRDKICTNVVLVTHKTCGVIEKEALIITTQKELDKLKGK